jgi:hypothetical protein
MQSGTFNISCPVCKAEFPLTETLAQPLIDAERQKAQRDVQERASALQALEAELVRDRQEMTELQRGLDEQASAIEATVQQKLQSERKTLAEVAEKKAAAFYAGKLSNAEQELAAAQAKITKAEAGELLARKEREELESAKRNLELTITRRLDEERDKLRKQATLEEQERWKAELVTRDRQLAEKDAQLCVAEQAELTIRKERQLLEEDKRKLELDVERRVDSERSKIREATQREEEESHRLKIAEKDKLIDDMRKQVEELRRKSDQGSQQVQGEVLEDEVQDFLTDAFTSDHFEAVPNGRPGGDLVQAVVTNGGLLCGSILWESKNTKNWCQDWLAKNRQDQLNLHAHIGVIVTAALPKGVNTFAFVDGVWVTSRSCALPLAFALRQTLLETARAQAAAKGSESKKELLYSYLTSKDFRQRIAAIVEAYMGMRKDLEAEKLALSRLWAKREKQLNGLMVQTAGVYGDVQGIVGKSMPEVEGLNVPLIEGASAPESAKEPGTATGEVQGSLN